MLAVFAISLFIFVIITYCKMLRGKADWFVTISIICLEVSLVIRATVAILEASGSITAADRMVPFV